MIIENIKDQKISDIDKTYLEIKNKRLQYPEWADEYYKLHRKRLQFDFNLLNYVENCKGKILEVGGAPFLLTSALKVNGYDITTIDIEPLRFDKIINHFNFETIQCDIETDLDTLSDNTYEVILFNEVFEHLRMNLISTMKSLRKILRDDGYLFLSTPNIKSLRGIFNYIFKDKCTSCADNIYDEYDKLNKLGHMGHVREYTVSEVVCFLEKIGFSVEKIVYRGSYNNPIANIVNTIFPRFKPFVTYIIRK